MTTLRILQNKFGLGHNGSRRKSQDLLHDEILVILQKTIYHFGFPDVVILASILVCLTSNLV